MDLRRKLARLRGPAPDAPVTDAPAPQATPPEAPSFVEDEAPPAPVDELRARLRAMAQRTSRSRKPRVAEVLVELLPWPFTRDDTADGPLHTATRVLPAGARHGAVALDRALRLSGAHAATLALDPSLAQFDASRALFLDTETTGLAGASGTLAFLVGMAWFEGGRLRVEQHFLDDPGCERPMLLRVAERIRGAGSLVSFNGRSFDMSLLRSRFVMGRVPPPPEPPHLDLLHVARRIYGGRVERCSLVTLERDVLDFARQGDVDGAEIPERYQRFLREGISARTALLPVVEHNVWDLAALAALAGELGARLARTEADGRFEAPDLVGLARTSQRAGDAGLAVLLASEAAAMGAARGDDRTARDAHVLAAKIHRRAQNADATVARLRDALAHAPGDAVLHLDLARNYERPLCDYVRALAHALKATGAEEPAALARRVARLRRRVQSLRLEQLRLPGF